MAFATASKTTHQSICLVPGFSRPASAKVAKINFGVNCDKISPSFVKVLLSFGSHFFEIMSFVEHRIYCFDLSLSSLQFVG